MSEMTSRERLLAVLRGEIPDRVPIAPFIQQEFLYTYFGRQNTDRLVDACICADELGFDLITKQNCDTTPYFLRRSFPNWEVATSSYVEAGNFYKVTTITTPKKTFRQVEGAPNEPDILGGIHFLTTQFMLESPEDFAIFKEYLPSPPGWARDEIIEHGRIAKQHIGQRGINAPWTYGGVFNLACTFMNIENMLMDALVDFDYYHEYMTFFSEILARNSEDIALSDYDMAGMQGNMANAAVMGPDHFANFVLPYERAAYKPLNQAGKPIVYHNCGTAKAFHPHYKNLGVQVYETLSPAPQGDTVLEEAKRFFADSPLILCGTFDQIAFLKQATPEEIYHKAAETVATGKPGGKYIFAASDYIELGTPLENCKAMLAGALSVSRY